MGSRRGLHSRMLGTASSAAAAALIAFAAAASPWAAAPAAAVSGINVNLATGHVIRGTVTDPHGAPVAGVSASAQSDTGFSSGVTAADGTFAIPGVVDGTYEIQFDPPEGSGLLPHWYGAPTSSDDPTGATDVVVSGVNVSGVNQALEAGTSISGTVSGVAGHPVAGVEIDASGQSSAGSAIAAADGTYAIEGLFPGVYSLMVRAPGGSDYLSGAIADGAVEDQPFGGSTFDTTAGDVAGADIQLATGITISGRITGGDGPVDVQADDANGGTSYAEATTSSTGDFSLDGLWPSSYNVIFGVPNDPANPFVNGFPYGAYSNGTLVDQNSGTPVDATGGDVTLVPITIPAGASLSGTIRSAGAPVAGAYLSICDQNGELGCVSTLTAANGTYRIGHFETGDWIIQISSAHHPGGYYSSGGLVTAASAATPVHVNASGPNVSGINASLPGGGAISGRITAGGVALAGANVFAISASGGIGPASPGLCTTSSTGQYTCDGLATGLYRLQVGPPDGSNALFGYYEASAPGHYTNDFNSATQIRVVDPSDHTPPTVQARSPAPGASGVARNVSVTATFSEFVVGVSGQSFTLTDSKGHEVAATVSYSDSTLTATLRPKALLAAHMTYRASLTNAITDWNGNRLGSRSWTFTTAADATPPRVIARNPPANATGVPSYTFVQATFSEAVQGVSGTTFVVAEQQTGQVQSGTVTYDPGSETATFSASFGLNSNTAYTVTLLAGISDLAGNPLAKTTWTFTTGE